MSAVVDSEYDMITIFVHFPIVPNQLWIVRFTKCFVSYPRILVFGCGFS